MEEGHGEEGEGDKRKEKVCPHSLGREVRG